MRTGLLCFGVFLLFMSCSDRLTSNRLKEDEELINKISDQLKYSISNPIKHSELVFPKSLDKNGKIQYVGKEDWASGFYPGVLWLMYDLTGKENWRVEATKYTMLLESEKTNTSNSDLGLKMMSSFGMGFRLSDNKEYRDILIQSARTLISNFNENIGCITNSGHYSDKSGCHVDIRNMMNLELLFQATKETGEPVFYNIAVKHALVTMKNQFRNDNSVYSLVNYDTLSGRLSGRMNRNGHSEELCCAEDQAWALYGYAMVYRETQNPVFLKQAEKIADYILRQPGVKQGEIISRETEVTNTSGQKYDTTSAAIIATALYELCKFSANRKIYLQTASNLVTTLSSDQFLDSSGDNSGFLLKHSVSPEILDETGSVIYADYYYLEAIKRKIEMENYNIN